MDSLSDEICFKICDAADFLKITPINFIQYNSVSDWDNNWVKTQVKVKADVFSCEYIADIMTTDFEWLKRGLITLNMDFNGSLNFEPLEREISFNIKGDGLGHFKVKCKAEPRPHLEAVLLFTLTFDQTQIKELVTQVDKITKAFPITGDINIANE